MKKRPIFFVLLLSFLFISCENLLSPKDSYNNGDGKTYTITGDINIEGALPNKLFNKNSTNSVARTGFPTVPKISDSDLNLYVSATNADSGSTIDGIINAEKTQYSIKLQKGKWTITVSGKKSDVVILEGSVTVVLNDEYPVEKAEKIILKPVQTTDGKGNLSLKLALGIESFKCGGVKATLSRSNIDFKTEYFKFTASEENPASEINLAFNDIPSGTYSFVLEFYEKMSSDGSDYECENIIYILNDTVNIFDGLTTNEWSGTGYSDDTFTLTQEMIANFAMTTFYVSENGDDSNLGTFFEPVKTIQNAVDKVIAMNVVTASSEGNPYKILLLSDIYTPSNDSFKNNKALVNIDPSSASSNDKPLYLTISKCGDGNATINANRTDTNTGRVMYIGENANVTLQNLILTGGYLKNGINEYENGAGLYILNNNANVIIENSEISRNVIENGYGAGLHVGKQADKSLNLTIENSKISSNTIKHNNAGGEYSGAGIAIVNVGANIKITDSEISDNVINQDGVNADIPEDKGVGLCLGNRATTIISGTAIKNNIIKNPASTNENAGGGVYLDGGSLTIQNSTKNNTVISGNSSTIGGGVAVTTAISARPTGSVSMSGGTISENIVTSSSDGSGGNGSAVAVLSGGLFTVSDNITIEGDVYLYENQNITVSNNFEGEEVMITPYKYANDGVGVQVLDGESLTAEIVGKFKVTPQRLGDVHKNWFVDLYGYLGKVPETETNDDGTVVYLMESYDNLLYIAQGIKTGSITSLNMKLTDDIDIPRGKWQFSQLNAPDHSTIDGQGHSITINEDVSKFGNSAGGLFYKCNLSTVKNLVLKGSITANTSGDDGYIGALCRSAYRTTIQNVMSTVTVQDNGSGNAGGLVGYFGGNKGDTEPESYIPGSFIQNCAVYANIESTKGTVGGLVGCTWKGYQCWQINNCIYKGNVTVNEGTDQGVGAIIGTHKTGRTSTFKNTWYCANGTSEIVGKYDNEENGENFDDDYVRTVISKTPTDIASEDAATFLNTNSDETDNYVWKFNSGSDYPTLSLKTGS